MLYAKRDKLDKKAELGIFVGYSTNTKCYRIFNVEMRKVSVNRDVMFDENAMWNWDKKVAKLIKSKQQMGDISSDEVQFEEDSDSNTEVPIKGTRLLADIYDRCNVAILERYDYIEASKFDEWRVAMEEELKIIEKNKTWSLVNRPDQKSNWC